MLAISKKMGSQATRDTIAAYGFLLPSLVGLVGFTLFPIVYSFGVALLEWDGFATPRFVGIGNYTQAFADPSFWQVLWATTYYTMGLTVLSVVVGLILAVALNQKIRGLTFYRTVHFIPIVTTWAAAALTWQYLYGTESGVFNLFLQYLGIPKIPWLTSQVWAMPAIIITSVWKTVGLKVILYLAGLQGIPQEYYEAAEIDGATPWKIFFYVTLPLMTPVIFFTIIVTIIGSFQVFDQVFIMTNGGPASSTEVIVYYIYVNAFRWFNLGYASAISWLLFVVILALTLVQWRSQKRWVFYG